MRKALGMLAIVALLAIAVPASAQDFGSALPNYTGPPTPNPENPPGQYLWDDGSSENSLGLTAGGELAWINGFQVTAGNTTLTSVMTAYGTPAFPDPSLNGRTGRLFVWRDGGAFPGDGNPANAVLLGSANTVAANSSTDIFNKTNMGPFNLGAVGQWFFIGATLNQNAGQFPGPMDQSSGPPYSDNAWVAGSSAQGGFDPNNLGGGIGLFRMSQIGFPTEWLLRANAVPEPATLGLLALGGLAMLRRRR